MRKWMASLSCVLMGAICDADALMESLHGLLQLSVSHTDFSSVLQGKQFFLIHWSSITGHFLKNIWSKKKKGQFGRRHPSASRQDITAAHVSRHISTCVSFFCLDDVGLGFGSFFFFIFISLIAETKCLHWKQYSIIIRRADWTQCDGFMHLRTAGHRFHPG